MHFYRSVGEALLAGPRREVGERFRRMSFDEVVKDWGVYGTAERVVERLTELGEVIGFTKLAVWMNVGPRVPHERVGAAMRRFGEPVAPRPSTPPRGSRRPGAGRRSPARG